MKDQQQRMITKESLLKNSYYSMTNKYRLVNDNGNALKNNQNSLFKSD
jgi:hypothetical protein